MPLHVKLSCRLVSAPQEKRKPAGLPKSHMLHRGQMGANLLKVSCLDKGKTFRQVTVLTRANLV